MKWQPSKFLLFAAICAMWISYTSCDLPNSLNSGSHITVMGNPFSSSMKIVKATCEVLLRAHPELTDDKCQRGVLSTSISNALGVPQETLNPFRTLADAEQNGSVKANPLPLEQCLGAIAELSPQAPEVQNAYDSSLFNAFNNVIQMIPGGSGSCPDVYRGNTFTNPTPTPPPPGTSLVDFDNPPPPPIAGDKGAVSGIFQKIDFGQDIWFLQNPFSADTSTSIFPSDKTSGVFQFSGGPEILVSIDAFSVQSGGLLTISDDLGQSTSQYIPPDLQMHTILTGFTKPSNVITVSYPTSYDFAIDNILIRPLPNPPSIAHIQEAHGGSSSLDTSAGFTTDTGAGNLIIVQATVSEVHGFSGVTDNQGNIYQSAVGPATSMVRTVQQIWFAKNIAGGPDTITVHASGDLYNLNTLVYIHEYSGLDPNSPLDASAYQVGSGGTLDSGYVATSAPFELIFSGALSDDADVLPGPDFAPRSTYLGRLSQDRIVSVQGSYHATAVQTDPSRNWLILMATFKSR